MSSLLINNKYKECAVFAFLVQFIPNHIFNVGRNG